MSSIKPKKKKNIKRVEASVPRVIRKAKCGHCESTALQVAYTEVFRESGFRRVTAHCHDCGAVNWWHEDL